MAMLKRLFGSSEFQKLFEQCRVDKSHELMVIKRILEVSSKLFLPPSRPSENNNVSINININPTLNNHINISINSNAPKTARGQEPQQRRKELTALILRKIRSTSDVQRIKGLALAHGIIKKTYDSEFMEAVGEQVENYIFSCEKEEGQSKRLDTMQREFIHQNIISFYCQYLKRFIINIDTFRYAERYLNGGRLPSEGSIVEMVSQGFVILNLCNYILQSQYTFNKMGRYYIEHKEVINLFLMYLSDLAVYNSFIKELSRLSLKNFQSATQEEIRHHFLFVTESQKTSDRLYEFFYNRYYYTQVKKLMLMPTFLTIHADQYKQLADYVKKNDPDLLQLVKNSKFAHGRSSSRPKTSVTDQQDMATRMNKTELMMKEEKDFFSFMSYVQEEHKDLEDITEVTVKRYTINKP